MSINLVVLDGVVKSLALRYDSQAKAELRWTLAQTDHATDGQPWVSYWPCCAAGNTALRLAESLEDGQHIILTSARLCYRKRQTKLGEQSRVEVLVWTADVLHRSAPDTHEVAPEYDVKGEVPTFNEGHSGEPETQQTREPAPKARRTRYPRYTGAQTAMREP